MESPLLLEYNERDIYIQTYAHTFKIHCNKGVLKMMNRKYYRIT